MAWLEGKFSILMDTLLKNGDLHKSILNNGKHFRLFLVMKILSHFCLEDVLRRYAFGVLSDYLSESLAVTLKRRLDIKEVEVFAEPPKAISMGNKRSASGENENEENCVPTKVF